MLYFEMFTVIRLGLILTMTVVFLLYRSKKLSIFRVNFKKEKKQT